MNKFNKQENQSTTAHLQLVGGALCLDFTNTAGNHADDHPSEHLFTYRDLVGWSQHAGILSEGQAHRLFRAAVARPDHASQVFTRAIALREAMYRVFSAASTGSSPNTPDMKLFNGALENALSNARLIETNDGFIWEWRRDESALDHMLAPIVRSAADLLTSIDLNRIRECEGDTCGWLFVDKSKNHSRRWCAMNDCGNRAKARRHYKRIQLS